MNKSDHDLLIDITRSVQDFHTQYAADEVRKDKLRSEVQARQKDICDAQNKWIGKIQKDVETLKNWRTGIVGGVTAIVTYFKFKGKL